MKPSVLEIAALATTTLLAVLAPCLGRRFGRVRIDRVLAVAALVLAVSTYGGIVARMAVGPGFQHTWNVFHYFLGAKYFDELGYFDLYTCVAAADEGPGRRWGPYTPVRDLRTYRIVRRRDLPDCPRANFTEERWLAFHGDVRFLQATTSPGPDGRIVGDMEAESVWPTILTDKGFNPSPVWVVLGRALASLVRLDSPVGMRTLIALDGVLLILALGMVARVYGLDAAALALAFLVSFWGPYERLLGNLLQYTWLASLLVAACFWRKGYLRTSAAFFAWAVTTMVFPVLLVSGLVLQITWAALEGTRGPFRQVGRWLAWVGVFSALLVLVSILVLPSHGGAWTEFAAKIGIHGAHIHGEPFNIGLRNLVSTCCTGAFHGRFDYIDHLAERRLLYYGLAAGLLGLFAVGAGRPRLRAESVLALGFVPVFALLSLSRYYYVGLVLFALAPRRAAIVGVLLATNLAFLALGGYVCTTSATIYYPYWAVQIFFGLFFGGLLLSLPRRGRTPGASGGSMHGVAGND